MHFVLRCDRPISTMIGRTLFERPASPQAVFLAQRPVCTFNLDAALQQQP